MIIIDRFEGNFAVLETENGMVNVERSRLPYNASEGDILVWNQGNYLIDHEATQQRKAAMASRFSRLRRE